MKNKFRLILTTAIIFMVTTIPGTLSAQTSDEKQTVEIKTSAVCGTCKTTIEKAVYSVAGVKSATLDVKTKVVTVVFNSGKTSVEEIKNAIVMAGYDADEIAANSAAYERLHFCCKKTE